MRYRNPTIVELRFVERITLALFQILNYELKCQVSMALCCRTVIAAMSLRRSSDAGRTDHYIGLPWSTSNAIKFLAGMGYVFDPRLVFEAMRRIEDRYIVDTRRLQYASPRRVRSEEARRISHYRRSPSSERRHATVLTPRYRTA